MTAWTTLTFNRNASFGDRVFINMAWRAGAGRSNKLTMWIAPIIGREDTPRAWRFYARSGQNDLSEDQTADLLAGVFTMLAAHGHDPDTISFTQIAALAQRPQHHIPASQKEAALRHLKRQKSLDLCHATGVGLAE